MAKDNPRASAIYREAIGQLARNNKGRLTVRIKRDAPGRLMLEMKRLPDGDLLVDFIVIEPPTKAS